MRERLGPGIHKGVFTAATDAARYVGLDVPIAIFTIDSHGAHALDEWGSTASMHAYAEFFTQYLSSLR
jgi:acetylornithine deacetylase/succinyl-diaminopimelate desuccinylase-like protein